MIKDLFMVDRVICRSILLSYQLCLLDVRAVFLSHSKSVISMYVFASISNSLVFFDS